MNSSENFLLRFSLFLLSFVIVLADGVGSFSFSGQNPLEVAQFMRINGEIVERINRKGRDLSSPSEQEGIPMPISLDRVNMAKCRLIRVKINTHPGTTKSESSGGKGTTPHPTQTETSLKCNGTNNFTISLGHIPTKLFSSIKTIEITNSTIQTLNLEEFQIFPSLRNLSVTHSVISRVIGQPPGSLLSLNLSHNQLKSIEIVGTSLFPPKILPSSLSPSSDSLGTELQVAINGSIEEKKSSGGKESDHHDEEATALSHLQAIDLSHNKISELPKFIFYLTNLKSLRLSGNQLKCEFVWEKMWEWYEMLSDPTILADADETFCGVVDDVRVFQYTIIDVLKARKDLEETCGSVDKELCPECSLYAFQRENQNQSQNNKSSHGSISISLKLDCSNRNLTELPHIPPQTWQLNISNNFIRDLSPLNRPEYSNLLILDADNNQVNLDTLLPTTPFLEKYNYLSLQNNSFTNIPSYMLASFKTMRGQGVTFFGGNFINCDCSAVKEIKPLLIENSKRIKDMKDIYCKDVSSSYGSSFMRVKDLQYSDVCEMDSPSEISNECYLYLVILAEVLLILLIIAKVWHDQRTFRRTGILPWCSAKMPRLPCDAMLEAIKEPPNFNRNLGSANSSNTNVNAHSISHIQLKDVRSGSTAPSDKSSSQPSQFSSFPSSSSRTSPV